MDKIPDHFIQCDECGEHFDMRDLSQVFAHDLIEPGTGRRYCMNEEQRAELKRDLPPITAHRVGDAEEWHDGKKINLN